ncbi:two-partner secretion domain-containing protein, partial [Ursidibacter arcticus]
MNKIYRLKFSKRLNQLVVVSEITTGHDKNSGSSQSVDVNSVAETTKGSGLLKIKPLSALLSLFTLGFAAPTFASGLQGMDVVHGTATMSVNGKNTTITNSPDAIINWKQFNINQDELVRFIQESSNSAVFNRVTSDQVSQLKGTLSSNGQVFLINPNGIFFGKDSVIDTAGFVASTLNIADEDIKRGNLAFAQAKDKAMAEIVNNGLITVAPNGTVALVGGSVKNNGVIKAENGNIFLLAGQKITISDLANPTITYSVSAPENEAVNLGEIFAKGGKINISAGSVKNRGVLNADSIQNKNGKIVLSAKEGTADVGGKISLNGGTISGGSLKITGNKVVIQDNAKFELTGKNGGTVYIGGDERGQGKNGIQLAKETHIKQGAVIDASATENGDGGRVVVWGDHAQIDGVIIARGGKTSGNGGFVETSGHYLGVSKTAKIDASAANGKGGEWLLDPYNVRIVAAPEQQSNVEVGPPLKVTGENAVILNTTIENALSQGTDVSILTYNPQDPAAGTQEGTLIVEADIVKNGGEDRTLKFESNSTFTLNDGKTIKSELGKLNLNITAGGLGTVLNGDVKTNAGNFTLTSTGLRATNANIDLSDVQGGTEVGTFNVDVKNGGQSAFYAQDITVTDSTFKGKGSLNFNTQLTSKNDSNFKRPVILNNATFVAPNADDTLTVKSDFQLRGTPNQFQGRRYGFEVSKLTADGEGTVNVEGIGQQGNTRGIQVKPNGEINAKNNVKLNLLSRNGNWGDFQPSTEIGAGATINAADTSNIAFEASRSGMNVLGDLNLIGNNITLKSSISGNFLGSMRSGLNLGQGTTTINAKNVNIQMANGRNVDPDNMARNTLSLGNLVIEQGNVNVTSNSDIVLKADSIVQKNASKLNITSGGALFVTKEVTFNGTNSGSNLTLAVRAINTGDYDAIRVFSPRNTINANNFPLGGPVNIENYNDAKIDITSTHADAKYNGIFGGEGVNFKNNDANSVTSNKGATINAPVSFDDDGSITAAGTLDIKKEVKAGTELTVTAPTTNVENGGKLTATDKVTTIGNDLNVKEGGEITVTAADGKVSIDNTGNVNNAGNITSPAGTVTVKNANSLTNSGNITASKDVEVNANNVNNSGNITSSTAKVVIQAVEAVTNTGNITAKTNVNVTAPTANLGGNVTAQDGAVVVDAAEKATVSGNVSGKTGVTTKGKDLEVAANGNITSSEGDINVNNTGDVTVKENGKISTLDGTGKINVEKPANLTVEAGGQIVSKTDVEVKAGNVTNAGEITATEGNANITADTKLDNSGNITAKTNVNVTAPTANLGGNVTAQEGAVVVDAAEKATVSGNVTGNTGVTTTGKNLEVAAGGNITSATGDINVNNTGDVTVKENGKISTLDGTGKINVDKPANLNVEAGGKIVSKTDVEVKAGNVTNAGEITASTGNANITADIKVDNSGNITAKNDVSLQAPDITNSGNVTSNDGKIKVDAA